MMNTALVRQHLASGRSLRAIKVDPSTERGARLLSYRLRIAWLKKGWDVPCVYGISMHGCEVGHKVRDMYGPKLLLANARRVSPEEAASLIEVLLDEMAGWASR